MIDSLGIIPGVSRLLYVSDLFKWLRDSLAAARRSTSLGYAKISDVLIHALSELAEEVGSVSLLKYVDELRDLNASITRANNGDDAEAMRLLMDKLPSATQQETDVRSLCIVRMLKWIAITIVVAGGFLLIKSFC
jgi:hypothetical protein